MPALFTGPFPGCPSKQYLGYEAEDLHRFAALYYWYKNTHGKVTQHSLPALPISCPPNSVSSNTLEQTTRNKRALESMLRAQMTDEEFLASHEEREHEVDADLDPSNVSGVDKGFKGVQLHKTTPNLDDDTRKTLMSHIAGHVNVLYEQIDRRNKLFTPDRDSVEHELQSAQHEPRNEELLTELREAGEWETEGSDADAKKAIFIALQKQLNAKSAAQPSWQECLDRMKLEVVDEPSSLSKLPFKILFRGVELLPWQPAAVVFIYNMLTGPLQACIDADDVGLGKTISILAQAILYAEHIDELLIAWKARYQKLLDKALVMWQKRHGKSPEDETLLHQSISPADLDDLGPKPKHRPFLVVVPPSAINSWIRDATRFFTSAKDGNSIVVRTFFSLAGKKAFAIERDRELANAAALRDFCASLDAGKAQTSRTAIIATYQSFHLRTLCDESGELLTRRNSSAHHREPLTRLPGSRNTDQHFKPNRRIVEDDGTTPDDEGDDASENDGLDEDDALDENDDLDEGDDLDEDDGEGDSDYVKLQITRSKLNIDADMFGFAVADEAHRLKNPYSKQSGAVGKLLCPVVMCTATPFINTVRDLSGLLEIVWSHIKQRFPHDFNAPTNQDFVENYNTFSTKYGCNVLQIPEEYLNIYLSCLNPQLYLDKITQSSATNSYVTGEIVPLPTSLICLRRVMGQTITVNGHDVELGKDIPPYQIVFVELEQGPVEAAYYRAIERRVLSGQRSGSIAANAHDDQVEKIVAARRRTLQQATMNRLLDNFQCYMVKLDAKTARFQQSKGLDSFEFFYRHTVETLQLIPPDDRVRMLLYVCRPSAKSCYLVRELQRVVVAKDLKMLVYDDWPATLWVSELICEILQIPFMSIRSGIKMAERQEAERAYNEDPNMKVLICSSRSAAESLNLQYGGHHILVLDIVPINTLLQIAGRQFRVGQKHPQEIRVVCVDETEDQNIQASNLIKYRAQLAGTATVDPNHDFVRRSHDAQRHEDETSVTTAAQLNEGFLHKTSQDRLLDGLVRSMFGLRSDRHKWRHASDPTAKNLLPLERIFRLAYGGDIAQRMIQQLDDEGPDVDQGSEANDTVDAQPLFSITALSNPLCFRRTVKDPVDDERLSREILKAADEEVENDEAYRGLQCNSADVLREARTWVPDPKLVDRALQMSSERHDAAGPSADGAQPEGSERSSADGTQPEGSPIRTAQRSMNEGNFLTPEPSVPEHTSPPAIAPQVPTASNHWPATSRGMSQQTAQSPSEAVRTKRAPSPQEVDTNTQLTKKARLSEAGLGNHAAEDENEEQQKQQDHHSETQEEEAAPETQEGEAAPETQKGGAAPETQEGEAAPETQKGEAAPETQEEEAAPVTQPAGQTQNRPVRRSTRRHTGRGKKG